MIKPETQQQLHNAQEQLRALFGVLARPNILRALQLVLLVLLLLWGARSLARLFWAAWPHPPVAAPVAVINPASTTVGAQQTVEVDLPAMLELGLFGDPTNEGVAEVVTPEPAQAPRDGIESNARETRLALKLMGIVASTDDGLGTAVIEAKNQQENYTVGDALPAPGKVSLAKVLPGQVVLDNNGTYELLKLYDDTGLAEQIKVSEAAPAVTATAAVAPTAAPKVVKVNSAQTAKLAGNYREQLYNNPQSLAKIVRVAAVRDEQGLRGYRIAPGADAAQFKALGFESGDVVTAVNGLALSDPTNTMRLYQLMRDATEATFDIDRKGQSVTVSVSLAAK